MDQNARYREILIAPIRECASYTPKFGHGRQGGFSLSEFRRCMVRTHFIAGWDWIIR